MVRGVHVISFLDSTTNITWNCYDQNLPFGRLRPPCDIDINVAQFYKKNNKCTVMPSVKSMYLSSVS